MFPARLCCLDLDTFFVSVERLLDPELVGQPVIVGATPGKRGVVTACSYEVRPLGVRSGMPIAEAVRLAPDAIYLPGRHTSYGPYAKQVRAVIERTTPAVQTASIDEFYLDLAGCERLYREPDDADDDATIERVVRALRQSIQDEVGLPSSVGVGVSRSIAKIASGRAKPAGVLMVRPGEERAFLAPLPVRRLPGIGPKTEARLLKDGLETLGQLMDLPPGRIRARWGGLARRLDRVMNPGTRPRLERSRPAFREHDPGGETAGTISNERTFMADVGDEDAIHRQLLKLVERVCHRARKREVRARTITLRLRYADFHTITRSRTLAPTDLEAEVLAAITALYKKHRTRRLAVRLLGVRLSNLVGPELQLALPFSAEAPRPEGALDDLRKRFGYEAVRVGGVGKAGGWLA